MSILKRAYVGEELVQIVPPWPDEDVFGHVEDPGAAVKVRYVNGVTAMVPWTDVVWRSE